jgi:Cys-tRNA(Pro)/Cys-tRNA(Cys) deacylase
MESKHAHPKSSDFKNNVTRFLDSKKVKYTVHTYDYDAGIESAVQVAAVIGLPAAQVFKTLVVLPDQPNRKPMLVVIPGPDTLDLKALAKGANLKKARMAAHAEAESLTGLQTGGISPLALIHKGFDVYISTAAQQFDKIAISAGQRGANIQLAVKDLVKLVNARYVQLTA